VSAFYFHPDIKTYNFQASFLKTGVFDIYTHLIQNREQLTLKEEFVYFPLTYFLLGGYQIVVSPIMGSGFNSWLANASSNAFVLDPNIFKYLMVLKLPYLALDILIAFILKRFFDDKEKGEKAFKLWLFNPFTIFLIYAISNIDIFAVTLTLAAFLYFSKEKPILGSVFLGLAAGFKLYPLLFTPFLFLYGKGIKEKLTLSLTPWLIFGLICTPFISPDFFHSALVSGLSTGILKSELGVLAISALFFYAVTVDKKINLLSYWVILFLMVFSFPLYHIQWLLWVAPFVVILVIQRPKLIPIVLILSITSFVIPLLYQDRFMTMGLLRAYSLLYDMLPTPFLAVQKVYDPYSLVSAIHAAMAGATLVLAYKLFKKEEKPL
jgi:uncharacterized membrane protein